jgi:hypothetical protein
VSENREGQSGLMAPALSGPLTTAKDDLSWASAPLSRIRAAQDVRVHGASLEVSQASAGGPPSSKNGLCRLN